MDEIEFQTQQFELNRSHLRSVAQRILGSAAEAEDAVQEAWLRLSGADTTSVENMRGWLTVVTSRICLDMLRSRRARREDSLEDWMPDPIVILDTRGDLGGDPAEQALLADSVGLALLVVLDALPPAQRLAFVLHDMFGMPFEEIAPIVERTVPATRQLASRARRAVRGAPAPEPRTMLEQRRVVEAFLAASREGDFDGLVAVLDPDVQFRAHTGPEGPPVPTELTGARDVAELVLLRGAPFARFGRTAIIENRLGAIVVLPDRVQSVVAFTIRDGRIAEMDLLVDPERLKSVRV